MKYYTEMLKVLKKEYLRPSSYGNPKQWLFLETIGGWRFSAKTATNAVCGYYGFVAGESYIFTYHYTKTGNIIIDYFKEV